MPLLTRIAGFVVCRFERSSLPDHAFTQTIVLRILRVLDLVENEPYELTQFNPQADPLRVPVPGELLLRTLQSQPRPWALNVDAKYNEAFRILHDNEPES